MTRKLLLLLLVLILAACDSQSESSQANPTLKVAVNFSDTSVQEGQINYSVVCLPCHGPEAIGIPGLGPNLRESEFVHSKTDEELLVFIIQGRPADHPDNTSGIAMPPRAGMPNLKDEQIASIITYLRSLTP
ncbi:MAG: c-type cytochrome [Anaerolineae bacterium]|nr:c-type cytochrome [Anaerolineae bacterium]